MERNRSKAICLIDYIHAPKINNLLMFGYQEEFRSRSEILDLAEYSDLI